MSEKMIEDTNTTPTDTRSKFLDIWPILAGELEDLMKAHNMPEEVIEWYKENLNHNTMYRNWDCGATVVETLEILYGRTLSSQEFFKASVLGWCVELLQAYLFVTDDMMNHPLIRRGEACWYRIPQIGSTSTGDSFMLEAALYHLLKLHFRTESCYVYILELFLETTFRTAIGKHIDLLMAQANELDLDKFSLKTYQKIVIYRTAYYSFYLPVALGMRYAGICSNEAYATALSILIPIGEYFQIQEDYLDCHGTPEQTGKAGTDIVDNKCSWNVTVALQHADERQRRVLEEHYGRKDEESEARVKEVYNELQIDRLYRDYEERTYTRLNRLIESIPETLNTARLPGEEGKAYEPMMKPYPLTASALGAGEDKVSLKREIFASLLNKVHDRQKK